MCGASKNGIQEETRERELSDDYYIPKPFLEDLFEPFEQCHILAMLDVCTNEAISTQFCDKEGYDVAPFCMVQSKLTLEYTISGKENAVHSFFLLLLVCC